MTRVERHNLMICSYPQKMNICSARKQEVVFLKHSEGNVQVLFLMLQASAGLHER